MVTLQRAQRTDVEYLEILSYWISGVASRLIHLRRGQVGAAVAPMPKPPRSGRIARLVSRAGLSRVEASTVSLLAAASRSASTSADLDRISGFGSRDGVAASALAQACCQCGGDPDAVLATTIPGGKLERLGLVRALGCENLATRRITLSARVLAYFFGPIVDPPNDVPTSCFETALPIDQLVVASGFLDRARYLLHQSLGGGRALWISGPRGVGKRTVLASLAAEAGQRLLCIDYRIALSMDRSIGSALRRETLVADALPCIVGAEPAQTDAPWLLPAFYNAMASTNLPVIFTSQAPPCLGEFDTAPLTVHQSAPDAAARARLWARLLPDVERIEEFAPQYRLPPGRIVRVAEAARIASIAEARSPAQADIIGAVSGEIAQNITPLGERIGGTQTWDDLVLRPKTIDAIREIVSRARWRNQVLQEWGFGRNPANRFGISALFVGAPGTGKTMCAGLIARDLGLELYQIKLSRIASQCIAETKRTLDVVFDAADWGNVLLVFEEADSLFAKRTEDPSPNRRFANTDYLLQRLERFAGVAIFTSNLGDVIDRGLSFRVDFAAPDVAERELLWKRMVPPEARLDEELDFERLATAHELTGGDIRNAMLRAAFLAAEQRCGIRMSHVLASVTMGHGDSGLNRLERPFRSRFPVRRYREQAAIRIHKMNSEST